MPNHSTFGSRKPKDWAVALRAEKLRAEKKKQKRQPRKREKKLCTIPFVLAACEAITGIPHMITAAPLEEYNYGISLARRLEWYCLRKFAGLSYRETAKLYTTTFQCIGFGVRKITAEVNKNSKRFTPDIRDIVDQASAPMLAMLLPKNYVPKTSAPAGTEQTDVGGDWWARL